MRSLVCVAMQQPRPGPAYRRDFGGGFINILKQLALLIPQPGYTAWPGCDIAIISANIMALSKPFDLVLFRGAAHVLWPTTNRMRIDMFPPRQNVEP